MDTYRVVSPAAARHYTTLGETCSSHGHLPTATTTSSGMCVCDTGYAGADCSACDVGYQLKGLVCAGVSMAQCDADACGCRRYHRHPSLRSSGGCIYPLPLAVTGLMDRACQSASAESLAALPRHVILCLLVPLPTIQHSHARNKVHVPRCIQRRLLRSLCRGVCQPPCVPDPGRLPPRMQQQWPLRCCQRPLRL